jgi:ribosome-associated protein
MFCKEEIIEPIQNPVLESIEEKKEIIIESLKSIKASDITILKVGELTSIADYFIICTVDNITLLRMTLETVERDMRKNKHHLIYRPQQEKSNWMILDFGDILVHVFMDFERKYYDLEGYWDKAPKTIISL